MDIEQLWEKAQRKTEVIRGRVKSLPTFQHTRVPYIFLGESALHDGHTIVRKGKVLVEKPMIVLPEDLPQFEGFDLEEEMQIGPGSLQMFFLMRGIRFPSLKYNNTIDNLDLKEEALSECAAKYRKLLEREENVSTALIMGPEDCWQFSILIYMAGLVGRCVRTDISNMIDRFRDFMDK